MNNNRLFSMIITSLFIYPTTGSAIKLAGKDLVKNGTGVRTKYYMTIYYATLYVPAELKGKSGKEIIEADLPMSVIMKIDSQMLTSDKFMSAIEEGFANAAGSGYPSKDTGTFLSNFKTLEITKGDKIILNYEPGRGVTTSLQVKATGKTITKAKIAGLQFKKALFAIWLGPKPAQESLKNKMLGN